MELDPWQKEVLETEGNIVLCSGRQQGKSTIISIKSAEKAAKNKNQSILIISATERQAEELFIKVLFYLDDNFPKLIKKGKDRPTKHIIRLSNGSIIRCLPTGLSGTGIRGFTVNTLIADEAAFMPDDVWSAVTPMLLTTGGEIILISTPKGRQGYFYQCYNDENFKRFHVNAEENINNRPTSPTWTENQRTRALMHLEAEKTRMSKREYAQEYLGQFVEDVAQFFPDNLIKSSMKSVRKGISVENSYILGVDIARMGEDESVFAIIDERSRDLLLHVENVITTRTLTTETTKKIIELDNKYHFRKIYLDSSGVGAGVLDQLLDENKIKRRVIAIENAKKDLDREGEVKKKVNKEILYSNLLRLMDSGKILLLDDPEIFLSLKSVQYEYKDNGELRIFGDYTHCAEALIRAAWCIKDKHLKIWVRS